MAGNANAKAGPFDAMLCVGTFFGEGAGQALLPYLTGKQEVPVPTFFICGAEPEGLPVGLPEEGCEICHNLTYLGRQGTREIAGLTVKYLSGVYDPSTYSTPRPTTNADDLQFDNKYRARDIFHVPNGCEWLSSSRGPVDVLLTAEWGLGCDSLLEPSPLAPPPPAAADAAAATAVAEDDAAAIPRPSPTLSAPVGDLLKGRCNPRYHFAGSSEGVHLVLHPYRNAEPLGCSRFYGMAGCANKYKAKSLQALNVKLRSPLQTEAERNAAVSRSRSGCSPSHCSAGVFLSISTDIQSG